MCLPCLWESFSGMQGSVHLSKFRVRKILPDLLFFYSYDVC